jgi:hypothetical protein
MDFEELGSGDAGGFKGHARLLEEPVAFVKILFQFLRGNSGATFFSPGIHHLPAGMNFGVNEGLGFYAQLSPCLTVPVSEGAAGFTGNRAAWRLARA